MAEYTMHHLVVGENTYEIVDETARENVLVALSAYLTDTASGAVASFPDGADNVPVKSLSVAVEPVQSGSGDPSPSNIRPISGWDAVKVFRTPINAPMSTFTGDGYESGVYLTSTGATQESVSYAITAYIPVTPGKTVIIHAGRVSNPSFGWYDANKTYISGEKYNSRVPITLTVPDGVAYIRCSWNASTNYIEADVDVYDIDLPQTVYGGTLDVASGVLTIDKGYRTLTSSLNWSKFSSGYIFYVTVADKAFGGTNVISEKFVTNASRPNLSVSGSATTHAVYFRDDSCADVAAFLSAYPELNIVYELEIPQTVQLSPTEVTTLLGQNNIYADSGSVAVTYRADTGLYIDKRLNA